MKFEEMLKERRLEELFDKVQAHESDLEWIKKHLEHERSVTVGFAMVLIGVGVVLGLGAHYLLGLILG